MNLSLGPKATQLKLESSEVTEFLAPKQVTLQSHTFCTKFFGHFSETISKRLYMCKSKNPSNQVEKKDLEWEL